MIYVYVWLLSTLDTMQYWMEWHMDVTDSRYNVIVTGCSIICGDGWDAVVWFIPYHMPTVLFCIIWYG